MNSTQNTPTAGHIGIDIYLNDAQQNGASIIDRVVINNSRPQDLGRLMIGLSPDQALQRIPQLFLLCSQAQQAAAYSALADAQGLTLKENLKQTLVQRCSLEWLKEHSWQLWQMERALFGNDFAQQESLATTKLLLQILQQQPALSLNNVQENHALITPIDWDTIRESFIPLFGLKPREFLVLSWTELMHWSKGSAPYAKLWTTLLDMSLVYFGAFSDWKQELESGPMARQHQLHPLVKQSLELWGASLITRTLARLIELTQACVNPQIAMPIERGSAQASRGELKHTVSLNKQGIIASYKMDAPTDRHFSQGGLLENSLVGQHLPHNNSKWVEQLVWAIDPCVEFSVKTHRNDS